MTKIIILSRYKLLYVSSYQVFHVNKTAVRDKNKNKNFNWL